MWVVLGLYLGFIVFSYIWVIAGPIVALLNFVVGRFFIASVIMTISLFCASFIWPEDIIVTADEYKVLLGFGLVLEAVKYGLKGLWHLRRMERESEADIPNVVINIVDDEPEPQMKDVTPRVRRLTRW
jgi:hypothetical protein